MINYIKSEIYKNLRLKENYITIIALMAFVIFLNIVLHLFAKQYPDFSYANTSFAFSSLYTSLYVVIMFSPLAVSLIFGQEYKNNTLKNTVSFGISRSIIYFSKLLITIVYALILGLLVVGAFIISAYLLLDNSGVEQLKLLIDSLIAGIPIFLFSITLAHSLYFNIEKEMNVITLWTIIIIIIPKLLNMIGRRSEFFRWLSNYMPWNIIQNITYNEATREMVLVWTTPNGILRSIIVSAIGCVIFYFIGLEIFKKKEIK
ncbi:MAG: hypothetical protein E7212_08005 [Clostridium sartagoforme]|nr:hypothetical protein [Clostridium sartagoforme]